MGPVEARDALMEIARRKGRAFSNHEIYQGALSWEGYDPDAAFGVGVDFERTVEVADLVRDQTVTAVARLRVIATTQGTLFLRAMLLWKPRRGQGEHSSCAKYEINEAAAERLEISPTLDECKDRGIDPVPAVVCRARSCKAFWQQQIPTASSDATTQEEVATWNDVDALAEDDAAAYHVRVIVTLREPMLCMLSYGCEGDVGRHEIETLLDWVEQQPEVAAAA